MTTRKYITAAKSSDLDWRIKPNNKYEVVGQIGDDYLVWANGHQSLVEADNVARIEVIEVEDEDGGEQQGESKRAWAKRKSNRRD